MTRGSEWRKWDLHVHTPGTAKNDQYGDTEEVWSQYIECLEKSDISVFGITDYFSMDNYYRVLEFQDQGYLKGKTILPNVEMRIEPVTKSGTAINIHAIFDPSLTKEELEREFFGCLAIKSGEKTYHCVNSQLVDFGRELADDPSYPEKAAKEKAIGEFVVPFDEVHKILEKPFFANRLIIALSGKSNDGLSGLLNTDCNTHTLRTQLGRMADIILSSNANDIAYFLGERADDKDKVIATYRSLKPCIIGSDAHNMASVGVFPNDRITWIKADPTFEGLKQILFEPKERVRISDTQPDIKYDFNVIDYVQLNTANVWSQNVYFNQNLTTIIGGRSTGKSTLLTSIATKLHQDKGAGKNEFIKNLTDNVHVVWRDGHENDEKEIEYFTQNEISNIIDKGNPDGLFLNLLQSDSDKREAYEKFQSEEAHQYSSIQSKVTLFFEIKRKYVEKQAYIKTLGDKDGIIRELDKLEKEILSIQQKLTDKKELIDNFQTKEKNLNSLTGNKLRVMNELSTLENYSVFDFVILNPALSLSGLREDNRELIIEEIQRVISQSNTKLQAFVNTRHSITKEKVQELDRQINDILRDETYLEGKSIFDANKNLATLTEQVKSLYVKKNEIEKECIILNDLEKEYKEIAVELLRDHLFYLEMMNSIASVMTVHHDNIRLFASYELKPDLEKFLNESLSLRSNHATELISIIVTLYQKKTKDDLMNCISDIFRKALRGEMSFKNGYAASSFISNILSNNWFELKFNVEYENDKLNDMSPGKRSFVVLKLLLDFSNKDCPILIDQPEDNLDNRAIYTELVKYIREKKKERQIILVTHNPNIVVGADSEEIIVSNQNGKNSPNDNAIKFQYISGSLENSSPLVNNPNMPLLRRCGIREHVCDILEGGENAFRDRENKYGFFKI